MKEFYTLEEVLTTSEAPLSLLDIIGYCRKGVLHPCVYLHGNLVCIEETREHYSADKRDYPVHNMEAKWHVPFQGYVYSQNLIDNYVHMMILLTYVILKKLYASILKNQLMN